MLLIYQGTGWADIPKLSDDEKKSIAAEYVALGETSGVTPGMPLGLPDDATTVEVKDGETVLKDGPFIDSEGAIGGYFVYEAGDLDAAVELASRIPAARRGGAVEVRPVGAYW